MQKYCTIGINNTTLSNSGTSFAAPQISGIAALLMSRTASLQNYPTAVKAILMASAFHNIEGSQRLSDQDGAGSIDAQLAYRTASTYFSTNQPCYKPCWWTQSTSNTSPVVGDKISRRFNLAFPGRVRVAIAWWAQADAPSSYPSLVNDRLISDFNLHVHDLAGNDVVPPSSSFDNNYEIVDFYAASAGVYEIVIYKSSADLSVQDNNSLGIAWVTNQQLVYLPIIANQGTSSSYFYSTKTSSAYPAPNESLAPPVITNSTTNKVNPYP